MNEQTTDPRDPQCAGGQWCRCRVSTPCGPGGSVPILASTYRGVTMPAEYHGAASYVMSDHPLAVLPPLCSEWAAWRAGVDAALDAARIAMIR